jgi:hypothetical protein
MKAVLSPSPVRPTPLPRPAHTVRASNGHAQLLGVVFFFVELLEPALLALLLHLDAGGEEKSETAKARRSGERCFSSSEVCSSFRDVDGNSKVGEGGGGSREGVRVERACGYVGLSGLCSCFVSS